MYIIYKMKEMREFKKKELYDEYVRLKNKYEPEYETETVIIVEKNNIRCYGNSGEGTRCYYCDRRIWGRKIWYDKETCDICKKTTA